MKFKKILAEWQKINDNFNNTSFVGDDGVLYLVSIPVIKLGMWNMNDGMVSCFYSQCFY